MGNSGISVLLFVYLTLYVKYMQTFSSTCDLENLMLKIKIRNLKDQRHHGTCKVGEAKFKDFR